MIFGMDATSIEDTDELKTKGWKFHNPKDESWHASWNDDDNDNIIYGGNY